MSFAQKTMETLYLKHEDKQSFNNTNHYRMVKYWLVLFAISYENRKCTYWSL